MLQRQKRTASHDLSPDGRLVTRGGQGGQWKAGREPGDKPEWTGGARRAGQAVVTTRAKSSKRSCLAGILATRAGITMVRLLMSTRKGRKQLLRIAYREGYAAAAMLDKSPESCKLAGDKLRYQTLKAMQRDCATLRQISEYNRAHRLGARFDHTDARATLFVVTGSEVRQASGDWHVSLRHDMSETAEEREHKRELIDNAGRWTRTIKHGPRLYNGEPIDIVKVRGVISL